MPLKILFDARFLDGSSYKTLDRNKNKENLTKNIISNVKTTFILHSVIWGALIAFFIVLYIYKQQMASNSSENLKVVNVYLSGPLYLRSQRSYLSFSVRFILQSH